MENSKQLIYEITGMFFRSKEFKVFNVSGGGYFVSLGLTTSLETMEKLKSVFNNSDYGFQASLVELRSIKDEEGEYINTITGRKPEKFKSEVPEGSIILRKEASFKYPEIAKSIEASNGGWGCHGILELPGRDPVVFYDYVNYSKDNEGELRIGIYVAENN